MAITGAAVAVVQPMQVAVSFSVAPAAWNLVTQAQPVSYQVWAYDRLD